MSIWLDVGICIEALTRHGKPAIFNSDQGPQFTSTAFTAVLHHEKIAISMDGKGSWQDNMFVERLWRSAKYEKVFLNAYASATASARRKQFRPDRERTAGVGKREGRSE